MKPMKMALLQPALHLLVHVAALRAVTFIDEDINTAHHRRLALQVGRIKLVDQRAHQAWRGCPEFSANSARGDARRCRILANHPCITHHAHDLLVQLITVGDDQDAGVRVKFSSHLAISTIRMLLPLPWVCQITPPSCCFTCPGPLHAVVLMDARHLLCLPSKMMKL